MKLSNRIRRMSRRRRKIAVLRGMRREMEVKLRQCLGMPWNAKTYFVIGEKVRGIIDNWIDEEKCDYTIRTPDGAAVKLRL